MMMIIIRKLFDCIVWYCILISVYVLTQAKIMYVAHLLYSLIIHVKLYISKKKLFENVVIRLDLILWIFIYIYICKYSPMFGINVPNIYAYQNVKYVFLKIKLLLIYLYIIYPYTHFTFGLYCGKKKV